MPHLQFETTAETAPEDRRAFADAITALYAEHMETGTGHVAVTVRDLDETAFSLGRLDPGEPALMLNADVREGRSDDRKRAFVLAAFEAAADRLAEDIPNAERRYLDRAYHWVMQDRPDAYRDAIAAFVGDSPTG
jgi:phenylpyruvate tautomerase PptA (4-oxalocrotonate tautomerase family)